MKRFAYLTRNVLLLSAVSMLNDVSSEILIPILPLYLAGIGYSTGLIGLLEGVTEAVAAYAKLYFGMLSDRKGRKKPFVFGGYLLSALAKSGMGLSALPAWVLTARSGDKVGKGLRTAARDAMLAAACSPATKGRVFGFHKAADTLGAVSGPCIALYWLSQNPGDYGSLFLIALFPALLASLLVLAVHEHKTPALPGIRLRQVWVYATRSNPAYRRLLGCLLLFSLFNSSDAFLLLMANDAGLTDGEVLLVYIGFNGVFALSAFPAGALADRIGSRMAMVTGLCFFALAYGLIAWHNSIAMLLLGFLVYGLFPAFTDGVSKAWLSYLVPAGERATALGFMGMMQGLALLAASLFTGLLWQWAGPLAALTVAAAGAVVSALAFVIFAPSHTSTNSLF